MIPKISVIVPVYNIMEWLPRCVKSLQDQTYSNLEIVLVDDGSTDGTGKLCDELAAGDERIRVFHKENGGSSSARNLGIRKATGEYLGFVDSDDYVEPDMYESLMKALSGKNGTIAQVGRNEIDEQGNLLADICIPPAEETFYPSEDFMRELLMHRGDCSFCTKLVPAELFRDREFPVGVLNEDFHLLITMLPDLAGIESLPGYKYHVFYRIGSNTRKKDENDFSRVFSDNIDNADLAAELVEQHFPGLDRIAFRFGLFQRLDYLLHIPIAQMTGDNRRYRDVVSHIRKHFGGMLGNRYLTFKNKVYLSLLAVAPRFVRKIHRKLRK